MVDLARAAAAGDSGRALVIAGAVIAGAVSAIPQIPGIPTEVTKWLPLTIALGVIGLAQEPEGTIALAQRQTHHVLGVMRPLAERAAPGAGGAPSVTVPVSVSAPARRPVTSHAR